MNIGLLKAGSPNLPKIDKFMIGKFFAMNQELYSTQLKNLKTSISAEESFGEDAIEYVQFKRDGEICILICKLCPEHKIHSKGYTVSVLVDEEKENISRVLCEDCPQANGKCKHAIAFLFWLHRHSMEPACTLVKCYWKKTNVQRIGPSLKILTSKNMCKYKHQEPVPNTRVMTEFVNLCKRKNIKTCQFLKYVC